MTRGYLFISSLSVTISIQSHFLLNNVQISRTVQVASKHTHTHTHSMSVLLMVYFDDAIVVQAHSVHLLNVFYIGTVANRRYNRFYGVKHSIHKMKHSINKALIRFCRGKFKIEFEHLFIYFQFVCVLMILLEMNQMKCNRIANMQTMYFPI